MAAVTLYLAGVVGVTPNFFGVMQTTAPAANLLGGWIPGNAALPAYLRGRLGATTVPGVTQATSWIDAQTGPVPGTGSTNTTAGDSFISPVTYNGTFAAGAWTITLPQRTQVATGAVGRLRMRVWRSANANGTSATELTSGAIVGSIITLNAAGTDFTSALTWSPGALTLTNEYLFFQIEWQETTLGPNSCDCYFRIGTAAITTTNFTDGAFALYPAGTAGVTPNWFGPMQTTPPATSPTLGYGPSNNALTVPFYRGRLGCVSATANITLNASWIDAQTGPVKGTGNSSVTAGDSFISPQTYTGTFAAGAWAINLTWRCTTVGAVGRIRMRVWASVNADGTSARELTSGAIVGSIINLNALATDFVSTLAWSPGAITMNNEYLFFQAEWQETTVGANSGANVVINLASAASSITTTSFTAGGGGAAPFLFRKRLNVIRR